MIRTSLKLAGRAAKFGGRTGLKSARVMGKSKPRLALLGMGAFAAGINSTDPVKASIATFEDSVMGDPNFSNSILGTQMGPGAYFRVPGSSMRYVNRTSINNAIMYRNTSRQMREVSPPGSMVFGMFNSRM